MALYITRCPTCQQAYRINDTQLAAKDGLVRCSFCKNVFNAKEHLYRSKDIPTETAVIRAEREAEMEQKGLASMTALSAQLQGFDAVDEENKSSGLIGIRTEPRLGPVRQDVINGSNRSIEIIQHEPQRVSAPIEEDEPEEEEIHEPQKSSKRALWGVIALLAALLIGLQLSLSYRGVIIEKLPQSEATLNTLCQYFVCQPINNANNATAAEEPKNIVLASQSLQRVGGDEYIIVANLHNEKTTEEAFPSMTVTLKGEKGDILTRRTLEPSDYLNDATQKLKPNETRQVAFTFKIAEGVPNHLSIELAQ